MWLPRLRSRNRAPRLAILRPPTSLGDSSQLGSDGPHSDHGAPWVVGSYANSQSNLGIVHVLRREFTLLHTGPFGSFDYPTLRLFAGQRSYNPFFLEFTLHGYLEHSKLRANLWVDETYTIILRRTNEFNHLDQTSIEKSEVSHMSWPA